MSCSGQNTTVLLFFLSSVIQKRHSFVIIASPFLHLEIMCTCILMQIEEAYKPFPTLGLVSAAAENEAEVY